MYDLPYFKAGDSQEILQFVKDHPFAFITGTDSRGWPVATQIPVFIEEREGKVFLTGHMMKQTDHHKAFLESEKVLCVFTGPHSYVSATWYSDPHQASTWNYMSVHARGVMRFQNDEALVEMLRKTTLHFEDGNPHSTTVFDNLPEDYTSKLMKAIVCFEIEVVEMNHVFKLSQNKDKESYQNIVEKLEERGGEAGEVAREMMKSGKSNTD